MPASRPSKEPLLQNWRVARRRAAPRRLRLPNRWPARVAAVFFVTTFTGISTYYGWRWLHHETPSTNVSLPEVTAASVRDTESLVKRFYEATDRDVILTMVRDPLHAGSLMKTWYDRNPVKALANIDIVPDSVSQIVWEGAPWLLLTAALPTGERLLAAEITENGPRLDWELAVGYQPMTFSEMMEKRPERLENVRVILEMEDYYNFAYSEAGQWQSFRLTYPEETITVFGYAPREGVLAQVLIEGARTYAPNFQICLTLGFRSGGGPQQVEILALESGTWLRKSSTKAD